MARPLRWNLPSTPLPEVVLTTPKDVYLYSNTGNPVALCLSCAVARRRDGATVELMSDKPARSGKCKDCGNA